MGMHSIHDGSGRYFVRRRNTYLERVVNAATIISTLYRPMNRIGDCEKYCAHIDLPVLQKVGDRKGLQVTRPMK